MHEMAERSKKFDPIPKHEYFTCANTDVHPSFVFPVNPLRDSTIVKVAKGAGGFSKHGHVLTANRRHLGHDELSRALSRVK